MHVKSTFFNEQHIGYIELFRPGKASPGPSPPSQQQKQNSRKERKFQKLEPQTKLSEDKRFKGGER